MATSQLAAGIGFFGAALLPLLVALYFLVSAFRKRHRIGQRRTWVWASVFILVLLSNPFSQPFLLEGYDSARGAAMARRGHRAGIIGMDQEQVRKLLGEPTRIRDYSGTPTWEYKQVPGYWMSSYFQVFFKAGKVYGIEANDD